MEPKPSDVLPNREVQEDCIPQATNMFWRHPPQSDSLQLPFPSSGESTFRFGELPHASILNQPLKWKGCQSDLSSTT